jgi:thiol-disulfide isomerase/thioredoxin
MGYGLVTINRTALFSIVAFVLLGSSAPQVYAAPGDKAAPATNKGTAAADSAQKAGMPKVLDFGAVWCVPCKKFAPTFDKVAKKYKDKVQFIHYDSEKGEGKTLSDKYNILK